MPVDTRWLKACPQGIYHATGPDYALSMGALLATCAAVSGSDTQPVWAPADLLAAQQITPWSELPLWLPEGPDTAGFSAVDCSRAIAAGLCFYSLAETVRDTLAWLSTRPADYRWRAGLDPAKQATALAALRH